MANYPNSIPSFTSKSAGQTVQPGHVNDAQDEIVAIGTQLLTWAAYTPTWTSGGVAVTVGNGILSGRYAIVGTTVFYRIIAQYGSTTSDPNPGNAWIFSTPTGYSTNIGQFASGNCYIENSGVAAYAGWTPTFSAGSPLFSIYSPGTAAANSTTLTNINPFVFAVNDYLVIQGSYEKA